MSLLQRERTGAGDPSLEPLEALIEEARARQRRRRKAAASVTLVLGLVGSLLVLTLGGPPRRTRSPLGTSGVKRPILTAGASAGSAAASSAWAAPGRLSGVSCNGPRCVAVGDSNESSGSPGTSGLKAVARVLYSSDAGRRWSPGELPGGLDDLAAVECTSGARCIAVGRTVGSASTTYGVIVASSDGGQVWVKDRVPADTVPLTTLSCPSALVCVAAGDPASPTGIGVARPEEIVSVVTFDAGRTWRKAILPADVAGLGSVSCAGSGCLATGTAKVAPHSGPYATGASLVLASSDGGLRWHKVANPVVIDPVTRQPVHLSTPESVACTNAGHCILAGTVDGSYQSAALVTPDGGTSWQLTSGWLAQTPASPSPEAPVVMTCPTTTRCVAIADYVTIPGGVELVSDDGGSSWRVVSSINLAGVANSLLSARALSCPSPRACVVVGTGLSGWMFAATSTDGGASWVGSSLPVPLAGLRAVSCWSTKGCMAVGSISTLQGVAVVTLDAGRHWSLRELPPGTPSLYAVSCPGAGACIAMSGGPGGLVGPYHVVALSTTDAGAHWHVATVAASGSVPALACTGATTCWAVGATSGFSPLAEVTRDGGRTWRAVPVARAVTGLVAVTCTDPSRCLALSTDTVHNGVDLGSFVLRLVGTSGTASWQVVAHLPLAWRLQGITCTTPKRCLIAAVSATGSAPNWRGRILGSTDGGAHWRLLARSPDNYQALDAISCPTPGPCIGVGSGPPSSGAGIVSSGGANGSWIARVIPSGIGNLYAIACTSPEHCVAVGTRPGSAAALETLDGGRSWSASRLPAFVLANASRIDASF